MKCALNAVRPPIAVTRRPNRAERHFASRISKGGFTLVEVMAGTAMIVIMGIGLYAGIGAAFAQLRLSRENLRATQILVGKMEVIRQCNWNQSVPGFIPTTFSEPYYSSNPTNSTANFVYNGYVTITNAPVTESYSNDLRMIQITLKWTSANVHHQRQMTTFVSQWGLQNYVY